MLTDKSMEQTVRKLDRFCETLHACIFRPVGQATMLGMYQTKQPLHNIPDVSCFETVPDEWGGEGVYGWFRMEYTVPQGLEDQDLYLYPHTGFFESTLWVNGMIHSNFAAKYNEGSHGNHWCNCFARSVHEGDHFDLAMECYAWHDVPGTQPLENDRMKSYTYHVGPTDVCVKDAQYFDFYFDLKTLLSLRRSLPADSYRRAEIENALYSAHKCLFYDPDTCSEEVFREGIRAAHVPVMMQLQKKNGDTSPYIGLTGHSHMDTAWLWPMTETEKKCARTYANQLNLMLDYPEYRFIQSSAYHSDWIRRDYPELFMRIQEAVAAGKYEPNGGVWVECDCNLTGGESMIRQFLWGQRFTQKYFNYTSDCFWLPDTFGYSSAIPQIMKGCQIQYFLTTKLSWNDTNRFPLTSFLWEGLDGTRVLTHFNRTHAGPDPESFARLTRGDEDTQEKRVSPMRLFSFGKGDGGGGPEFEMLESARRLSDLEGTARSEYISVSDFMRKLEKNMVDPTVYSGELYLELHRGTLTNQHTIKRNNRLCEIALHNLELALVQTAVAGGKDADESVVAPLMNTLLIHQFHDILPGTCIHSVHEKAHQVMGETICEARRKTDEVLSDGGDALRVYNSLSFDRSDAIYLNGHYSGIEGASIQCFTNLLGEKMTAVAGITVPAFGSVHLVQGESEKAASPFVLDGSHLTTPFADITFDEYGAMKSFVNRRNGRELVKGLPFNSFIMAEDLPAGWDNWDVDADEEEKFRRTGVLLSREVISDGPVELRIRSHYRLSDKSEIHQDMVFDAQTPMVTFETVMDWQDDHRFLKVAFDTSLHADGVRNEIQFGCLRRPNTRSTSLEKARFEVCNHKYSDLSESNNGVSVFNDGKYGISVLEGSMRLSLHKGGLRPDDHGDHGRHVCRYALWVHDTGFGAQSVVQPAYRFNYRHLQVNSGLQLPPLVSVSAPEVIIETVKPCEDTQHAYILRLYEAVGGYSRVRLSFSHPVKAMYICNMLEEEEQACDPSGELVFAPFKILTLKVVY